MEKTSEAVDKLHFERSVYEQFMEYTRRFSKNEWGGLLIGIKSRGESYCVAAVIPPQKSQSTIYCEFKKELFAVISNCFEKVTDKFGSNDLSILGWIHTHPGFTAFLSSTDLETYNTLIKYNSDWSALVVDPVRREFLSVNSKPGNCYGFSELELDLDYLQDFKNLDQSLFEKLTTIKENINSGINRKLFKLESSESIQIFIPIGIESLTETVLNSRLEGLLEQTALVRTLLFQQQPSNSEINESLPNESVQKISEKIHPDIQKLEHYITTFQKIENELNKWPNYSVDRLLIFFDYRQIPKRNVLIKLGKKLQAFSRLFWAIPVLNYKLTDHYFYYANSNFSKRIEWKKIRQIEFDELDEIGDMILISYKTGYLFGNNTLLLLIPQASIQKLTEVFALKTSIFNKRKKSTTKIIDKFLRFQEERQKQKKSEKLVLEKEESIRPEKKGTSEAQPEYIA